MLSEADRCLYIVILSTAPDSATKCAVGYGYTILQYFQEWAKSVESKLRLVNSILASWVPTFHSHYGPRNEEEVHIFGCADIISLLQYSIKLKNGLKIHTL